MDISTQITEYKQSFESDCLNNNMLHHFNECRLDMQKDDNMISNIQKFVQVFIDYSNRYTNNLEFQSLESIYLSALVTYLYKEAPDDEQNMYMVTELLYAGIKSDTIEESDLDRLFNMLQEKSANHPSLLLYKEFKEKINQNEQAVIYSCIDRMSDFDVRTDFFYNVKQDTDISKIVNSFISNTNAIYSWSIKNAERDFLLALFMHIYNDKRISILLKQLKNGKPISTYLMEYVKEDKIFNDLMKSVNCNRDSWEDIRKSVKSRLEFWK